MLCHITFAWMLHTSYCTHWEDKYENQTSIFKKGNNTKQCPLRDENYNALSRKNTSPFLWNEHCHSFSTIQEASLKKHADSHFNILTNTIYGQHTHLTFQLLYTQLFLNTILLHFCATICAWDYKHYSPEFSHCNFEGGSFNYISFLNKKNTHKVDTTM